MTKKTIQTIFCMSVLSLFLVLCSNNVLAQQSESPVACDESEEPILLHYGDYTTDSIISPTTDVDTFTFVATSGEKIRINIDATTDYFDPRLEIRDPDSTVILDTYCDSNVYGTCSLSEDIDLTMSGTYSLAISDSGSNNEGSYIMQLERIFPANTPIALEYNSTVFDEISPTTDTDIMTFEGTELTSIRINIDATTDYFDPRLEIRDPDSTVILDTYCDSNVYGTCSLSEDIDLTMSGTYSLAISDSGTNNEGNYNVDLQCMFGTCPIATVPPVVPDIDNPNAYLILTDDFKYTLPTGSATQVYGSMGANNVVLESGAGAKFLNFPDENTITIKADSSLFTVLRSGSTVTIKDTETDGTILSIPATTTVQTIIFNDSSYELFIDAGTIYLGETAIIIEDTEYSFQNE